MEEISLDKRSKNAIAVKLKISTVDLLTKLWRVMNKQVMKVSALRLEQSKESEITATMFSGFRCCLANSSTPGCS